MTLQELLSYCKSKVQYHQAEAKRQEGKINYGMADVHKAKAEAYRDVGLRLGTILEEQNESLLEEE